MLAKTAFAAAPAWLKSVLPALALAIGVGLVATEAQAGPTTLTFATLPNEVTIQNYFNGGLSGFPPSGTGPSDGLVFSSNAEELKDTVGRLAGNGKFENNPSGLNGVLFFAFSNSTISFINDATGFTGFSLSYSLLNNLASEDITVDLWSGLGGTGNLLGALSLNAAGTTVACTAAVHPVDEFCTWSGAATDDFGVAESVSFGTGNNADVVEFDDVTFVPEPATGALLLGGLAMLGLRAKRRRAASL